MLVALGIGSLELLRQLHYALPVFFLSPLASFLRLGHGSQLLLSCLELASGGLGFRPQVIEGSSTSNQDEYHRPVLEQHIPEAHSPW